MRKEDKVAYQPIPKHTKLDPSTQHKPDALNKRDKQALTVMAARQLLSGQDKKEMAAYLPPAEKTKPKEPITSGQINRRYHGRA